MSDQHSPTSDTAAEAVAVTEGSGATERAAKPRSGRVSGFFRWFRTVSGDIGVHWLPFLLIVVLVLMVAGLIGASFGLPNLYRDDCQLLTADGYGWKSIVNSPLFLAQVFCGLIGAIVWTFVLVQRMNGPAMPAVLGGSLSTFSSRFFVLSLFFLAAGAANIYLARETALLSPGYVDCYEVGTHLQAAAIRVALGWGMGLVIGFIYAIFILTLHYLLGTAEKDESGASVAGWLLWLLGVVILAGLWLYPVLIPAASILVFVITLLALYTFLASLPRGLRFPAFVALLAWIVFANSDPFKYEFPGIETADGTSYYAPEVTANTATDATDPALIDPVAALQSWKDRWQESQPAPDPAGEPAAAPASEGGEPAVETGAAPSGEVVQAADTPAAKPKLVLVATSGGAYRAAFWTGLVLDRLLEEEEAADQPLTGITEAVRLITGASGGMVGAAYFAANRTETGPAPVEPVTIGGVTFGPTVSSLWQDILAAQEKTPAVKARLMAEREGMDEASVDPACFQRETKYPIPGDSLSPVAQQLVQRDVFHLFIRRTFPCERGVILENQWTTLASTYADWRAGEAEGWRPSLILSPMIVEKGQPLLISNLDLASVRALPGGEEVAEFFNLFPGAGNSFRIKTAVRMNATFPLISPAVMLPTETPYRVVDAGYYDNYGVSVAISFLRAPEVQDWLVENVSQVILIQLRAFPIGPEAEQDDGAKTALEKVSLDLPFSFLTAPMQGASSARKSAMVYRNEQELNLVRTILDARVAGDDAREGSFLETVVFENDTSVSLNWYLTEKELVADLYDVTQPPGGGATAGLTPFEKQRREQKAAFAEAMQKLRTLWEQ